MLSYLIKPLRRLTRGEVWESGKWRKVVVILRPPNIVAFRAKGCRTEYEITAESGYEMAVRAHVAAKEREEKKTRKTRRKRSRKW